MDIRLAVLQAITEQAPDDRYDLQFVNWFGDGGWDSSGFDVDDFIERVKQLIESE